MKALSKLKAEEGIWMTDVPEPELGHNDLLIKIRKTAICGTDVHIYNWDEWSQLAVTVATVVAVVPICAATRSASALTARAASPNIW